MGKDRKIEAAMTETRLLKEETSTRL
jgi:hypothetical protein